MAETAETCQSTKKPETMKKLIVLFSSCLIAARAFAALSAGNPEYEPFANATNSGGTSYLIGGDLAGQSSASYAAYNASGQQWWEVGPSAASDKVATNQPIIVSGDLSYPGLYSIGGGQSVAFGGNGDSALCNLTTGTGGITSGTVYFSFVLQFTNISALTTTGTNFAALNNLQSWNSGSNTPAALAARVMVRSDGASGFNIGLQEGGANGSTGFSTVWDNTSFATSNIIFVVGSYTFNPNAGDDVAQLWVNPDSSTYGGASAPSPDLTSSGGSSDIARVASFVLLARAASEPYGLMDDLRIGLDWADVTPSSNYLNIEQKPVSQSLPDGYNATFSVVADGTPTLTYQWVKNGNILLTDGGNISGAYSNVLTISSISESDVGSYAVYVTNGLGKVVLTDSATLSLSDPSITNQPQGLTNDYGTTATFEVGALGTGPFTYQWQKDGGNLSDGGNISGSQSNVLTLTGVAYTDDGNYSVIVTNAVGATIQSAPATLAVNDPIIVTQPVSATNIAGGNVTFNVVAEGSNPPFTYQWFKNGDYLFDGGNISGSYSDTLTISDISSTDQANYSVLVIGNGNATSHNASLTIISPITIAAPPNPRTVAAGDPAVFAVGASGSGTFNYQWLLDGTNIPGATSFAYILTNAQVANAGSYSVIISNSYNSVTSAPVALTISNELSLDETNLVVIRVGDGAQALTLNGNSIFLDQYATNGDYINTVTIPDSGPSAEVAIGLDNINGVNSGSTTGSCLTRSLDGRFMVIAGYNTNLNYSDSLVNSFAADVPRGIGLINSHAQYILAVASTNSVFNQTYWRAAITDGTNNFWGSGGKSGTYYFGFSAPGAVVQNLFVNSRAMGLYNGDIYCAEASSPQGILKIDGMPTNSTTLTNYLFAGSSGTSDMAVSPDGNLIYVADQRATGSGGGVQRWDFDTGSSTWNLTYTLTDGYGSKGPRYVAADFSGANPVVYVTTDDNTLDNNRIVRTEDTGAGSTGMTLAYAGVNETFRGIYFGPVESALIVIPPVLSFERSETNLILNWSGSFFLQSATNVTGPYLDVPAAASPYTNSISGNGQLFFRLRN
jgi:Immunoglobulin domain/Immunoglobulin I-set domain